MNNIFAYRVSQFWNIDIFSGTFFQSSVRNNIEAKRLCSRILRLKSVEISEVIGILSEFKDGVHNSRR